MLSDPKYAAYMNAQKTWGTATAAMAEKIYKLETGNYEKSEGFTLGYTPGMTAPKSTYPYGWGNMQPFWDSKPQLKPIGTVSPSDSTMTYLKFPTFRAALATVCNFLAMNNNDPTKWNGGADPNYASKIAAITNDYVTG